MLSPDKPKAMRSTEFARTYLSISLPEKVINETLCPCSDHALAKAAETQLSSPTQPQGRAYLEAIALEVAAKIAELDKKAD